MKKLLIIGFVLLLAGCGVQQPTEPSETIQSTVPSSTGLYEPDSALEQQTGGAVRVYPLERDDYVGMASMGNKLLLISHEGSLTVLNGDLCEPVATFATGKELSVTDPDLCASEMGVTYYLENARQLVVLNPQLQETARHTLPEGVLGTPAVSLDNNEIYYCIGQEIWALDMKTQINRLVKSHSYASQQLTGIHFGGTVLTCQVTDQYGETGVIYISAQTGQTLSTDDTLFWLETYGEDYFAQRLDGSVLQQIIGKLDGQFKSLNVEGQGLYLKGALPLGGVVSCYEDEVGQKLTFYSVESGKRTSMVSLNGVQSPAALYADSRYMWILASEYQTGRTVLYRWDVNKTPVVDDTVYTGTLHTSQNPDTQSMAQCKTRIESMNELYDIRIELWEEGCQTGDYAMTAEHQPETVEHMLDEMETVLKQFPEDFLRKTVQTGWIRVQLVRSVGTDAESVQYWSGGDCYVAITSGADVKFALLQGIGCGIDSHVLGNSRDFDDWNDLNPGKFAYDNDYALNEMRQDLQYLEGDDRAFVDQLSMSFAHEDRSRIFASAMTEGNEELFALATMQAKLLRVCEGIREAYGLEKSAETYPWEQYLTKSLAYSK